MTKSFCNACPCDEEGLETPVFHPRRPPHLLPRPRARSRPACPGQRAGPSARSWATPPPHASAPPRDSAAPAHPRGPPAPPGRAWAPPRAACALRARGQRAGGWPGAAGRAPPRRGSRERPGPAAPTLRLTAGSSMAAAHPPCP